MNQYLIESRHKRKQCQNVMKIFKAHSYLTHFFWGCDDGVCTGWAIIEADSKGEALLSVPRFVRNSTKVIEVKKLTPVNI